MAFGLSCADYQVHLFPRGLGTQGVILDRSPGWTSLAWERRLRDKSLATVTMQNLAGASDACRGAFGAVTKWRNEVVIIRAGSGRVYSGPITGRAIQSGVGTINAAALDIWLTRRDIQKAHNLPTSDVTDAYLELWHDAMDRENSAKWQVENTGPVGVSVPVLIAPTDHIMADQAVQPLLDAGLDYVTIDRTTSVGPLDTSLITPQLLDSHVSALPDVSEDGTVQANRYGILAQSSGGNTLPAYGEAIDPDARRLDGELVTVEQPNTSTTTAMSDSDATDLAALRIRAYATIPPTVASVVLAPTAPFSFAELVPGRTMDVRLFNTPIPISGIYQITRVGVTLDQNGEVVTVELTPWVSVTGG